MSQDLLHRQAAKRLGQGGATDVRELARLLRDGPVETLAGLLEDVQRSYAEAEANRRRLAHALRVGSGELFEANIGLERRAAEAEALGAIQLAAQEGGDLRQIVATSLTAICGVFHWPLAHAWVSPQESSEPGGWHAWHVDSAQASLLSSPAQEALRRFAEEVSAPGADPFSLQADLLQSLEPQWFEDLAAGVPFDPDASTGGHSGPRSGVGIPVIIDGDVGILLEFFTLVPTPVDPARLAFAQRLALQLGQMLAHRKAESERATQLGQLDATLESTPDGVLVVDMQKRVLKANTRYLEMWRMSKDFMLSAQPMERLTWASDQLVNPDVFLEALSDQNAKNEATRKDELEFRDGRVFERYTQPMRVDGQVAGRIWIFRDVSSERRAEVERKSLEAKFLQSQKMEAVGQLAGGVAHDFNNLLSVILGYSELLAGQFDDTSPHQRLIGEVRKAGTRAASLTQQLLAFSRKQVLAPVEVDLNATVRAMANMVRRLIGENIELTARLQPDLGLVKADPNQLEQVILNLVVNARDAMPEGGRLWIETSNCQIATAAPASSGPPPGQYVVLSVRDTGCGMSEETRQRVFEPFFTTKELGKGTGLGLSTVYGIVQQSGGHILLESSEGQGSVFHIYLSQVTAVAGALGALPGTAAKGQRGSETILLVEDEEAVRNLIRELLATSGYRVIASKDQCEAERIAEDGTEPIHLMLTDVVMPGIDGRSLYRKLHRLRPEMRVLYMSGYTDDAIAMHGVLEEHTMFIAKPFTSVDLASKIRETLDATVASVV